MTHLGDAASALVDDELDGTARERALAHIATCDKCKADVETAHLMKTRLALAARADADLFVAQGLLDSLARMPRRPDALPVVGVRPAAVNHRPPVRRYVAAAGVAASVLAVGGGAATIGATGGVPAGPAAGVASTTVVSVTNVMPTPAWIPVVRTHPRSALSVVYRRP
jgi:anti-sigma factor RsiW